MKTIRFALAAWAITLLPTAKAGYYINLEFNIQFAAVAATLFETIHKHCEYDISVDGVLTPREMGDGWTEDRSDYGIDAYYLLLPAESLYYEDVEWLTYSGLPWVVEETFDEGMFHTIRYTVTDEIEGIITRVLLVTDVF